MLIVMRMRNVMQKQNIHNDIKYQSTELSNRYN